MSEVPESFSIDRTTQVVLQAWLDHVDADPEISDDDAASSPRLARRQNEWDEQNSAWRLLLGARLTNEVLRTMRGES